METPKRKRGRPKGACAEQVGSRYGVFLPPNIVRQVEQLADQHRTTCPWVIRCLVEDYFAKNGAK